MAFADSWRSDPDCPDLAESDERGRRDVIENSLIIDYCAEHPYRSAWAHESCSIITVDGAFRTWREEMGTTEVQRFYDNCVQDSCGCDSGGDCECLCTAIAAFADECAALGFPTRGRTIEICRAFPSCVFV